MRWRTICIILPSRCARFSISSIAHAEYTAIYTIYPLQYTRLALPQTIERLQPLQSVKEYAVNVHGEHSKFNGSSPSHGEH